LVAVGFVTADTRPIIAGKRTMRVTRYRISGAGARAGGQVI
jgi:hypothetical protein